MLDAKKIPKKWWLTQRRKSWGFCVRKLILGRNAQEAQLRLSVFKDGLDGSASSLRLIEVTR